MKSVMNIIHIRIVRGWETIGKRENARVTLNEVSVSFWILYVGSRIPITDLYDMVDYDGYSCMSKWDRLMEQ